MIKQKNGKCKLFENDGTTFICDARYRISVQTDSSGYQDNTGSLHDIDRSTLPSLDGQEGILKLEDGQELKFAVRGMDMVRTQLTIRINSVVAF